MEDNEIAAKRHKKRKTYCFCAPFASSLSQTPALKAVVASTILNNIQSEKARLRSARSVSPASLHCGRPYSATSRPARLWREILAEFKLPIPPLSAKKLEEVFGELLYTANRTEAANAVFACLRSLLSNRENAKAHNLERQAARQDAINRDPAFFKASREREEGIHRSGNAAAAWQTVLPHWLAAHLRRSQGQAGNEEKPAALHFCDQGGPVLRPSESRSPNTHGTRHPRVLAAVGRGGPVGNYFHRAWKPIARHA